MKMKRSSKNALSLFLCMVLVVAITLFTTGCNGNTEDAGQADRQTTQEVVTDNSGTGAVLEENGDSTEGYIISADATELGEGAKSFVFTVINSNGKETAFVIRTDKELVGEALIELALIEGEEGPYGLYVKTVNGITIDYDIDKAYWAFYVNGEYATSGVDTTAITEGDTYSFKVEK